MPRKMSPSRKKKNNLAPTGFIRKTRAQSRKEAQIQAENRKSSKRAVTQIVSSSRSADDSLSGKEIHSLSSGSASLAKSLSSPCSVSQKDRTPSPSESSSKVQVESSSQEGSDSQEVTIFPPLPEIDVSLAAFIRKVPYDFTNRKEACRYSLSKLEQEFPDTWKPQTQPYSQFFLTAEGETRFDKFRKRPFISERLVLASNEHNSGLLDLITENNMLESVQSIESYCKEVIYEFYANFQLDEDCQYNINFVYLRGNLYEFSPRIINHVLGFPQSKFQSKSELELDVCDDKMVSELTEEELDLWEGGFKAVKLNGILKKLFGIMCFNWIPSTNNTHVTYDRARLLYKMSKRLPFNLGKIIFNQIAAVVKKPDQGSLDKSKVLPFPSLIYMVLSFQREIPMVDPEEMVPGPKSYKVEFRNNSAVPSKPSSSAQGHVFWKSRVKDLLYISRLTKSVALRIARGDYPDSGNEEEMEEDSSGSSSF